MLGYCLEIEQCTAHTHICTCTDTHTQLQAHMNAHSGFLADMKEKKLLLFARKGLQPEIIITRKTN